MQKSIVLKWTRMKTLILLRKFKMRLMIKVFSMTSLLNREIFKNSSQDLKKYNQISLLTNSVALNQTFEIYIKPSCILF